jgi:hypothetical protein
VLDSMRDELAEGQRSLLALAAEQGAAADGAAAVQPVADPTIELAALLRDRRWARLALCSAQPAQGPCHPSALCSTSPKGLHWLTVQLLFLQL